MKIIVVGLGIGNLYVGCAEHLNWEVDTVDINKDLNPTFTEIPSTGSYDLGIVCTPNYLHKDTLDKLLPICKQVLVEKPGLESTEVWDTYMDKFPGRVFMVKNNCFRQLFYSVGLNLPNISHIELNWVNKDRVPKPGSWFTNKELSFGGVSRDLLPHLLQVAVAFVKYDVDNLKFIDGFKSQNFTLNDIDSTTYGTKVENGVYNVDDMCDVMLVYNDTLPIFCRAAWKTDEEESIEWKVFMRDGYHVSYKAGLCPETAYITMLESFEAGLDANGIMIHQKMDTFVHQVIDKLK
jgi:predicted dehydrogenase